MSRTRRWLITTLLLGSTVIVLAVVGVLARPAHWLVTETEGLDKWEAHQPFAGERVISQRFRVMAPTLSRLDVLIVDLKGQAHHTPIILTLHEENTVEPLRRVEVDSRLVLDDYYLPFAFAPIENTAGKIFIFTVAAPATTMAAPYALRLTADDAIPGGISLNGQEFVDRDSAFRTYRQTRQAYLLQQWLTKNRQSVRVLVSFIIVTGILVLLLPAVATAEPSSLPLLSLLIIGLAIALQVSVMQSLQGDPGGDGYYYYNAAQQITQGINPLSIKSYRVPLYSAMLVPGLLAAVPDFLWARILGVVATVGLAITLPALARQLRFHPLVGLLAFLWLLFNSHFLVTSVRPRPYHIFTFLLLLSTTLLFKLRTPWHAFGWGILLGIMGMTRQEAYVPTAILGIAYLLTLWQRHLPWPVIGRHILAVVVPFVLIVSPYFYYNYQHYGHPLHNPYSNRADTQNPHNLRELWHENVMSTRDVLGSAWLPSYLTAMKSGSQPLLLSALLVGAALIIGQERRRKLIPGRLLDGAAAIATLLIGAAFVRWVFFQGNNWAQQINVIVVAAMIVGLIELVRVGRWRGIVVALVMISQIGIAMWWQPNAKHFQQAFPFVSLLIAAVVVRLTGLSRAATDQAVLPRWRMSLRAAPLILLLAFLGSVAYRSLGVAIDTINYPAAAYAASIGIAEHMQRYPGKVAAERDTDPENVAYTFHSYLQYSFVPYEKQVSREAELAWLCVEKPRYLVDHDAVPFFTLPDDDTVATHFRKLATVEAVTHNDKKLRSTAYEILALPELCRGAGITHPGSMSLSY